MPAWKHACRRVPIIRHLARQMRDVNSLNGPFEGVVSWPARLARRVRFVAVYDRKINGAESWDTHANNFALLRDSLLPPADRGLAALIEDLAARGLLDSTLVVALGEFGRTPRVNAAAGRDHWPFCYSGILAGGGAREGFVYGSSDSLGAYVDSNPVTPADVAATIFWRFGLDPSSEIRDRTDRPYRLSDGQPILPAFGISS